MRATEHNPLQLTRGTHPLSGGRCSTDASLDYLWRHDPNGRPAGTSKAAYALHLGITTMLGERNRRRREVSLSNVEDALYHCSACERRANSTAGTVR